MKWVNSERVRGAEYACGFGWLAGAGELAEHTTGALPTYQVGISLGYSRVHGHTKYLLQYPLSLTPRRERESLLWVFYGESYYFRVQAFRGTGWVMIQTIQKT